MQRKTTSQIFTLCPHEPWSPHPSHQVGYWKQLTYQCYQWQGVMRSVDSWPAEYPRLMTTIFPLLQISLLPRTLDLGLANSMHIYVNRLRMWRCPSNGGFLIAIFIQIFIRWHWIISVFPVNYFYLPLILLLIVFLVATSTAVEHVFLQGCQLLSFTQNRLCASSIRAFLCLGSWGCNDLIFFKDVLAAVKAGLKRKREVSDLDVELIE